MLLGVREGSNDKGRGRADDPPTRACYGNVSPTRRSPRFERRFGSARYRPVRVNPSLTPREAARERAIYATGILLVQWLSVRYRPARVDNARAAVLRALALPDDDGDDGGDNDDARARARGTSYLAAANFRD